MRKKNIQSTIVAHQYDKKSRYILAHIIDDGEPIDISDYSINFKVYTQDDRAILDDKVTKQSETGDIIIELSESLLCSSGKHMAEVIIFNSTERLSTMNFTLVIEASVYPDDRVVSSDEFSALTDALAKVDHVQELVDEVEELVVDVTAAETDRAAAENTRQTNESVRISSEADRVSAESLRTSAEASRVTAETDRDTAETARISAENSRLLAENDRVAAETIRASNENTRITNEENRVSAESDRVVADAQRQEDIEEAIGKIDDGLADVQGAVDAASTAAEAANAAKEAAEAETEIQIANNTRAEELIDQMEDIVVEDTAVRKSQLAIPSNEYVTGVATLDNHAKLVLSQFPYDLATVRETEDIVEDYFNNL